ncbi:MAG: gliding motility-associated ABC transporter ATP-binding subunit GldA [Bacteroidales bacterium]|nr:gliding motility-associated ABC transporter ATP-binding subunit GldA [Bacteroidales bacterium]
MSISVKNITKLYDDQKALDNVSFETRPGEVVGLLGPNGAGKSTMMKIITCFIPPTSGSVLVAGFDIFNESIEVRRRVGYLPENNPLYTDMYVKEYLSWVAGIYKLGRQTDKRVKEMIGLTGLEIEQNKKIGALSKGYRQRVGLAQALIHNPEILILDEPTSGLDPNQLHDIRKLIREVGKEKTVMLSTHIMQEVEAVCSRAIIINRGIIVADDSAENLSRISTGTHYIKVEFSGVMDIAWLKKIKGVTKVSNIKDYMWEIETQASVDVRGDIFNLAVEKNLSVLTLQRDERRLEDVFQQLTRKK